jgi:DeoR family transcriptional regulator, aga operon transcriptional repressor
MKKSTLNNGKSTVQRRAKILELLNDSGQVNIYDLSNLFKVSDVTIRKDLDNLEKKNLLVRARGGALKAMRVGIDYELSDKKKKFFKEKQLIGKLAASLIEENDSIIMDSGTTTLEVARNLSRFNDLTVITNAINIASLLAEQENLRILVPGGNLRKKSFSLIGSQADENFRKYFCDKLFLAVDGFDLEYGLSTPNPEEAHLNRTMINMSKQLIVVTDSSKFLRRSFAFICPVERVDIVVTDENIHPDIRKKLETMNVKVMIAQ